ncbi:MAG TPA: DUF1353 domain-containing protein [Candidatus Saccharimonas sp.]|nr:DUF1353 domain-containing protein [Candidatus Saccharimonas sp.]
MPFIGPNIVVEEIDARRWRLIHPVVYKTGRHEFTVPTGFKTDFASVPHAFIWLVPPYGKYTKAAILHDYLSRLPGFNRSRADAIFRRAMQELGVSFLRRWIMWAAVRAGARLRDVTIKEFFIWLLIAVPTVAFLAIPGAVVLLWLAAFWVLEYVIFGTLVPTRSIANKPSFWLGADAIKRRR